MPDAHQDSIYKKLLDVRVRTDMSLRPTKHLKNTFTDFSGREQPLRIRYYQVQGILHLGLMKRFVLGDDTGLGKCVTEDTLLWTDQGLLPIAALAPKPMVQLVPGTFYKPAFPVKVWTGNKWAEVKRFYYDGLRATKKVKTRSGLSVEGSHRHPLNVRGTKGEGWRRLLEVQEGDFLLVDRQAPEWPEDPCITFHQTFATNAKRYTLPSRMSPQFARLLGYIVAEGHSPDQYTMTVTQHDPEAHADIRGLFRQVFGWGGNKNNAKRDISIEVTSVQIRSFLETCGIGPALSADKRVPPLVMRASRESVTGFLRGFFEGEGHAIEGSGVDVSSASKRLLRELHLLLLRLGIVSVLKPKKVKGRDHTYWRLTIFGEDARLFAERVGFVTRRKQDALNLVLEKVGNPNHDVVPHACEMVEALRTGIYARCGRHGYKGGGISKRWGSTFYNTLGHIRAGRRNPTYKFLNQMLRVGADVGVPENHPAMCAVRAVCSQHAFYDPVVSVENGYAEVMDIEVDDPEHCFVGNGLVNHNTLETIGALCVLWEKAPDRKVIVLTTKSATSQWVKEFAKFTTGVRVILCKGTKAQREKARDLYERSTGPIVLVMGYRSAVQDITQMQHWSGHIVIFDEATAFKNPKTQVHQVCAHLAAQAERAWGLTATLIKNNLIEGYGIYKVIMPDLFRMSDNRLMSERQFMLYYCLTQMIPVGRGRKVPKIVGYLPSKIQEFKALIDPCFLGRPKHEVATELPTLTTRQVDVLLTPEQEDKYAEALSGMLEMGDGDLKETTKLTAIIYCQQIVNDLELIGIETKSPKLDELVEMLTEGDLADENVIVFTRFRKMVDIIMPVLKTKKVSAVRITGSENEDQREAAKEAFQNPEKDVRVAVITTAGSEAINLQAAKALICYDTPWSAGDFLQLVGRMVRIGSVHDRCYVIHLIATSVRRSNTIDHRVMGVLGKKMVLIEAVLGKRLKGDGEGAIIPIENEISDLYDGLVRDARGEDG